MEPSEPAKQLALDPYKFTPLGLGAFKITTDAFSDDRGYFMEGYSKEVFAKHGIKADFIQYNTSKTKKGAIRGLHYQKDPHGQARFMRCVQGKLFDAAVDIRKGSPTFGQHITATIDSELKEALYLPGGFANIIMGISEVDAIAVYLVDNYYSREHETGLLWNDPDIGIKYPFQPTLISKKDMAWPRLKDLKL